MKYRHRQRQRENRRKRLSKDETCRRKHRYRDQDEAKEALKQLRFKHLVEMRAYFCPTCTGWHLTSRLS